jgi:hypothetical protein
MLHWSASDEPAPQTAAEPTIAANIATLQADGPRAAHRCGDCRGGETRARRPDATLSA